MNKRIISGITFLSLLITFFALSIKCGKDKAPTDPGVDVSVYVAKGWEFFEQSPPDYESALNTFRNT